jgi:hypothetical protein
MKVITSAPMFVNKNAKQTGPSELYYGPDGTVMDKAKAGAKGGKRRGDGQVWDKTKGAWVKAKDSGLLSSMGNLLNLGQNNDVPVSTEPYVDPNAKQPMSTGTKVLIGVAVVALIAGVWYVARPSKGK